MGRLSNVLSVSNCVPSLQTFKVFWTLLDQTIKLLEVLLKTRVQSGKRLKVCFDVCIRRAKLLKTFLNVCARLPRPSSNITKCLLSVARWAQTFATTFKRLAGWDKTLKALSNVWRSNPNVLSTFERLEVLALTLDNKRLKVLPVRVQTFEKVMNAWGLGPKLKTKTVKRLVVWTRQFEKLLNVWRSGHKRLKICQTCKAAGPEH